jgi:hypothetical protein
MGRRWQKHTTEISQALTAYESPQKSTTAATQNKNSIAKSTG